MYMFNNIIGSGSYTHYHCHYTGAGDSDTECLPVPQKQTIDKVQWQCKPDLVCDRRAN